MATFRQFTYTNNGTEIEFLQGFIDLICGLDTDITCEDASGNETTAAEQFANMTSSGRADFFFNFGNSLKIEFKRAATNNSNTNGYQILNNGSSLVTIRQTNQAQSPTTNIARSYFVTYIKTDSILALWIGNYNITVITGAAYSLMRIKTDESYYLSNGANTNPIGNTFTGNNLSVLFSTVLPYSCEAGNIDFIEKSIFVSGGTKVIELYEIKSCSTVTQFSNIALADGRNFYAIGSNAIVEITG